MQRHYLTDADMDRLRLFVHELQALHDYMQDQQHPDVERLGHLLQRFQASPDADRVRPHG